MYGINTFLAGANDTQLATKTPIKPHAESSGGTSPVIIFFFMFPCCAFALFGYFVY